MYSRIVNDHVVGSDTGALVLLRNLTEGVQEKTITELHDVCLVDASNLASVFGEGKGESELCDALRLGACDDLERLDDTADGLVLETRVLALRVLTDDRKVDILVARGEAGERLAEDD